MTTSALPDLDRLGNEALKALAIQLSADHAALLEELSEQRETLAQQETELAALEAEFAEQRLKLAEQSDELRTRRPRLRQSPTRFVLKRRRSRGRGASRCPHILSASSLRTLPHTTAARIAAAR